MALSAWQLTLLFLAMGGAIGLLWNISKKIDGISRLMHERALRERGGSLD